jgi:hypothetical protein
MLRYRTGGLRYRRGSRFIAPEGRLIAGGAALSHLRAALSQGVSNDTKSKKPPYPVHVTFGTPTAMPLQNTKPLQNTHAVRAATPTEKTLLVLLIPQLQHTKLNPAPLLYAAQPSALLIQRSTSSADELG